MKLAPDKFWHKLVSELICWFPTICFAANYHEGAQQCIEYIKIMGGWGSGSSAVQLVVSCEQFSTELQSRAVKCIVVHNWYN